MSESTELEVIPPTALEAITRGEIDVQISTAHKFPRSMAKFKQRAIDMATIDQSTAESCIYVRPVGQKNGKMQYAEGLSVRMAEIVGASYGNLRVGSMIVEQTDRYVITRGFAHDLESNFASTSENKEPTVTKEGRPMSEGMRAVIAKASLSKARRDATFQVVPKALCRPIEIAARKLIAGDVKSMDDRKAAAEQYVQRLNIDAARVWNALGINGPDDITSETLLTLTGIRNAIKDGDATIDEAFPPILSAGRVGKRSTEHSGPTISEQAAAEAAPKTDGPTAKELLAGILKKCAAANIGKSLLAGKAIELELLPEGATLESADAKALADIDDSFDEIVDKIKNPEA